MSKHVPMQEGTVISTLHFIRSEIIRDGLDGLGEVEALLRLRGVDPDTLYVPRKAFRSFKRGDLRRKVTQLLRKSPMLGRDITAVIHDLRPELTRLQASKRVYACLAIMKRLDLVDNENGVWLLTTL